MACVHSILCHWITIVIAVQTQNINITQYIETFSDELQAIMCEDVRVGGDKCDSHVYGVQDFIHSFQPYFDIGSEDASILATTVIDRLNARLNLRASFLHNMSAMLQSKCLRHAYENADTETLLPFDELYFAGNKERDASLPDDIEYNAIYQSNASFAASTYKLPNGMKYSKGNVRKDAQISELLDATMIDLYDTHCKDSVGNHEYCSMYFGTINGVFRQYPGTENSQTDGVYNDYDPRFRPWYVSAASGGKDVVILVDTSGSMSEKGRLGLAKKAIKSVLRTMGDSTFVNVVAFDDGTSLSCFGNQLVAATKRNIEALISFVDGLSADGGTNFDAAFKKAFSILNTKENVVNCHTSILFLTDGESDDPSSIVSSQNSADINAVIFSYTLGEGAKKGIPRKLAKMTNGIFTHINDGDSNLVTKMSSYYLYYTYGIPETNTIITSPYLDFDTGVVMVTMAQSVYINQTYFVGVVGTDIPLSVLSDAIGDITIGRKSYSFIINKESELILHPLIPDAFNLFGDNDEYNPILVTDVESDEFNKSVLHLMLQRESGAVSMDTEVKQPAGDVRYNGYIHEEAHLLYIYAGVGPASLSIAIVVYSESGMSTPFVPSFGMTGALNATNCDNATDVDPATIYECLAPFNVYHRLDLMLECESAWNDHAQIFNGSDLDETDEFYNAFFSETVYSVQYPTYFLQSGLFEQQYDALNVEPTCDELAQLHKLTNRLESVSEDRLPFNGVRHEIKANIINSIYALTSLHAFWKDAFLADGSSFVSLFFGHYMGLHISYPGKKFSNSYNPLIRPWYQRAVSYPDLFVWTTPYQHAVTGKLVTGASTIISSPFSERPFGVIGFNYEYTEFVSYWKDAMSGICDKANGDYCFLIDSSGFLLHFDGMEYDLGDEDISRKFFGDLEPTLMQSLLDRELFVNDTNTNWMIDSIDVSYIVDEDRYDAERFDEESSSFVGNSGRYTVHAISKTNLYLIYVEDYEVTGAYPRGCPYDEICSGVRSPGCLTQPKIEKVFLYKHTASSSTCDTPIVEVCTEPETLISIQKDIELACMSSISDFGICVLKQNQQSDICATDFVQTKECDGASIPNVFYILVIALFSVLFIL